MFNLLVAADGTAPAGQATGHAALTPALSRAPSESCAGSRIDNATQPPLSHRIYRLRTCSSLIGRRPELLPSAEGGRQAEETRGG
jgi:hypothetical protein